MKKTSNQGIYYLIISFSVLLISCTSKIETPVPIETKQSERSNPILLIENKVKDNVYLENDNVGGMTEALLKQKLQGISLEVNREPENAKVDPNNWTVTGTSKPGKIMNEEETFKAVMAANEGDKVNLIFDKSSNGLDAEQVRANIVEIGKYTTELLDRDDNRIKNIHLASQKIDYKKLKPGETFSFNGVVGVRSEAKGYEEAPIIIQTEDGPKKEDGIGGGICQVSTTLYNTAVKSGMEIIERHEHSKEIGYAPKGKDATVSYGSIDLKFKNIKEHTVMIRVIVKNYTLTVRILENRN